MLASDLSNEDLSTFIDDLFAFTVKMPILHRLATFRDDIVFFVYVYQAWKYRVDYSRVNEFGQGGEDEGVAEKAASKPLTAAADGKIEDVDVKDVQPTAKTSGSSTGSAKKRR